EREEDLYAALRVGAAGYLLKDMPPGELIEAVLQAGRGEPRIAPGMASRMLAELETDAPSDDPLAVLSERERAGRSRLADGLRRRGADGWGTRATAEGMVTSAPRVKTQVRHVLENRRFRTRPEAAAFAARHLS